MTPNAHPFWEKERERERGNNNKIKIKILSIKWFWLGSIPFKYENTNSKHFV